MRLHLPWLGSPFVLVRFPGLLLAILGAGVILGAAAGAGPVFVSSAGNATLHKGLDGLCPWGVGLSTDTYFAPYDAKGRPTKIPPSDSFAEANREIRSRADGHSLGPVIVTLFLTNRSEAYAPDRLRHRAPVQIIARDGATSHIQRLASADAPGGVWIPDTTARALGVAPGDRIALDLNFGLQRKPTVRVAGIYRDLSTAPITEWWCSMIGAIIPQNAFSLHVPPPPPIVLADRKLILRIADGLGQLGNGVTWEFPLDDRSLSLEQAGPLSRTLDAIAHGLTAKPNPFGTCGRLGCMSGHTDLPAVVERADRTVDSLRSPVTAVSWSGRIVALSLLAGAAGYWVTRRRSEVFLLAARGAGPVRMAVVVAVESLIPLLVAGGVGWAAALWVVRTAGPSSLINRGASRDGVAAALWMSVVGLGLMSLAVALVARRAVDAESAPHGLRLRRIPWDMAVATLAGASLYELLARGTGAVKTTAGKVELDVLVLLFPLLFIAAGTGIAARALALVLPRIARVVRRSPPAIYITVKRLAMSGPLAVGLITTAALGVGIFAYSSVLGSSLTATELAKAEVFTGSDLNAHVSETASIPPSLAGRATHVKAIPFSTLLGRGRLNTLAIDPKTFDRAAFWDQSFADRPLRGLLDAMRAPQPDGRIPVLISGISAPATGEVLIGYGMGGLQEVRVVGSTRHFPGSEANRPLLIVPIDAPEVDEAPGIDEFWVRGDPDRAEQILRAANVTIFIIVRAENVIQIADLSALAWAFGFLLSLGIATSLVAVVGSVLYLQARQRGRVVANDLAHRMGLSRRALRLPLILELGALLAIGVLLGLSLGWGAARLIVGRLDPVPYLSPGMLFRTPLKEWALVAGFTALLAWFGGWAVQLAAGRTNVAAALRTSA
jgi:putative ABC transport system permease protein